MTNLQPADSARLRAVPDDIGPLVFRASLPGDVAALVGRSTEVDDVTALVSADAPRIVTLVGPGGVGKTRLAVEVASRATPTFGGAVLYIPLAPIRDADLVLPAIVQAADWSAPDGRAPLDVLTEGFADRRVLLVLDNFEHVLAAAPAVRSLVESCAGLTLLVTSRNALRVRGEQPVTVDPLAVPEPDGTHTVRSVASTDAAALLAETVRRFDRSFAITAGNADAIAQICITLDGLPLALELAAARLRLLSPVEMVGLLDRRVDLLRTSQQVGLSHHRTLRATIDWSYRLLPPEAQDFFATLGVFAGGFTLDAAVAVNGVGAYDVLDVLELLVDSHLVRAGPDTDGEKRWVMLETLREFALAELTSSGRERSVRDAHADRCLGLVRELAPLVEGSDPAPALARLDRDLDNIRVAISWLLENGDADDARVLTMTGRLSRYWWARGLLAEGLAHLDAAIGCREWGTSAAKARALMMLANLAYLSSDLPRSRAAYEDAIAVSSALGDSIGLANARNNLALVLGDLGELDAADELHRNALAILRSVPGEERAVAVALNGLAAQAYYRGQLESSAELLAEAADAFRSIDDIVMVRIVIGNMAAVREAHGDLALALVARREALQLAREQQDVYGTQQSQANLALLLVRSGDLDAAQGELDDVLGSAVRPALLIEANARLARGLLALRRGDHPGALDELVTSLEQFGEAERMEGWLGALEVTGLVAAQSGEFAVALAFFAAADARRARAGGSPVGPHAAEVEHWRTAATSQVAPDLAADVSRRAGEWSSRDAIACARELAATLTANAPQPDREHDTLRAAGLTVREVEVARHVAERRTDQEIAEILFVSVRTVTTHVSSVLRKLDVSSRRDVPEAIARLASQPADGR